MDGHKEGRKDRGMDADGPNLRASGKMEKGKVQQEQIVKVRTEGDQGGSHF